MPPHLSKTCPQDNKCLIILQGIQINLVGKIYYLAALYQVASEMVTKG